MKANIENFTISKGILYILISWSKKGVGFGTTEFAIEKSGELSIKSEYMGKEFVKEVLSSLIDDATLKE